MLWRSGGTICWVICAIFTLIIRVSSTSSPNLNWTCASEGGLSWLKIIIFKCTTIRARQNVVADALSQKSHYHSVQIEDPSLSRLMHPLVLHQIALESSLWNRVIELQRTDVGIHQIKRKMKEEETKHFWVDENGILWFKDRLVVPKDRELWNQILSEAHSSKLSIHLGSSKMYLKVSPIKGVQRFGVKCKLAPRYVGPYRIIEKKGNVAYKVQLLVQLWAIFPIFHVSQLKKCLRVPKERVEVRDIKLKSDLVYEEKPVAVVDRKERVTRNRVVKI